jgi:hypothetical protein
MVPNVTIMAHYPQALHVRVKVDADVGVNPEELVSTAAVIFFESVDADLGVDGVGSGGSRGGHGVAEDNHEAKDGENEDVSKHFGRLWVDRGYLVGLWLGAVVVMVEASGRVFSLFNSLDYGKEVRDWVVRARGKG